MKNIFVLLFFVAGLASAQTYPAKPIRLIVPFPPGGGNDTVARAIAQEASPGLGQAIVVETSSTSSRSSPRTPFRANASRSCTTP